MNKRGLRGAARPEGLMASRFAGSQHGASAADALFALIGDEGVASHPYLRALDPFEGPEATRNLADAVHFLCVLHGRHPGLIDHAAESTACATSQRWLGHVAPAFSAERLFIMRLAVAAGPVPSTPGAADSEAAVSGQSRALQMLARSERRGCALGAAVALVIDWHAFRPLLDHAARRLGIDVPTCRLPGENDLGAVVEDAAGEPSVRRALGFGASQVLVQHRGLLDLLEARQSARQDS